MYERQTVAYRGTGRYLEPVRTWPVSISYVLVVISDHHRHSERIQRQKAWRSCETVDMAGPENRNQMIVVGWEAGGGVCDDTPSVSRIGLAEEETYGAQYQIQLQGRHGEPTNRAFAVILGFTEH